MHLFIGLTQGRTAYRDAIGVLLSDALSFSLALLEGVLVLELGAHDDGGWWG